MKIKKNVIINANSIEYMNSMPKESVDLIFADPPYWMRVEGQLNRVEGTKFDGCDDYWDQFNSLGEYEKFTEEWLRACYRILKPDGSIWVIGGMQCIYMVGAIMQNIGYWFINDVIWHKKNPTPNFMGTRLNNSHETLIWATKSKKSKFTFNYKTAKELNTDTVSEEEFDKGTRKQMGSVWSFSVCSGNERLKDDEGNKLHSTQKPLEMLERIIAISSNKNDIVLDRPNGMGTFSIVYNGKRSNAEVIAWGPTSYESAINLWASEKVDWLEKNENKETGHYTYLINPDLKYYGLAFAKGNRENGSITSKGSWMGQASRRDASPNENTTNLTGEIKAKVPLRADFLREGFNHNFKTIKQGENINPEITNKVYHDGKREPFSTNFSENLFKFKGTLTSSNENVVRVVDGKLQGVGEGTAEITLTTENGETIKLSVQVEPKAKIVSIDAIDSVSTPAGVKPELPSTVNATYSDGVKKEVAVTWDDINESLYEGNYDNTIASFTVQGVVEGYSEKAEIVVNVASATVEKVRFETLDSKIREITVESGEKPVLDEKAMISWSNGKNEVLPISWEENEGYKNRMGGDYTLTKEVYGQTLTTIVHVNKATVDNVVLENTQETTNEISVDSGTKPQLVANATITWSNGDVTTQPIIWSESEEYKNRLGGDYTLKASIEGVELTTVVHVNKATITNVETLKNLTTKQGVELKLPENLNVTWSNGDVTEESIVWDEIDVSEFGTKTLHGSIPSIKRDIEIEVSIVEKEIVSIDEIDAVTVESGENPKEKLPKTVHVNYDNNTHGDVLVTWTEAEDYKNRLGGEYYLEGTIDSWNGQNPTIKVVVNKATARNVVLENTQETTNEISVNSGEKPQLLANATITWSNGDVTTQPIAWSESEEYKNRLGGDYTLTATVEGVKLSTIVHVNAATVTKVNFVGTDSTIISVVTDTKTMPKLPTIVDVLWSNNEVTREEIVWPSDETYSNGYGEYTLETELHGMMLMAKVKVVDTVNVTFDNNGHGMAVDTVIIEKGTMIDNPITLSEEGFEFKGWYTDKEGKEMWNFENSFDNDTILYAHWEKVITEDDNVLVAEKDTVIENTKDTPNTSDNSNGIYLVSLLLTGLALIIMKKVKFEKK